MKKMKKSHLQTKQTLKINESTPFSVHLSINRNDELLAASSQATLPSLGVKSSDLIDYSLDSSNFREFGQKSKTNQSIVGDSMGIEAVELGSTSKSENQASTDTNPGAEEPESKDVKLGDMTLADIKKLSEPLFLKKILFEESGDTCEFTIVIMTVHAVMLDSGFVLFNLDSCMRFSFSEETSVSLKYTLPSMISGKGTETVSLKCENLDQVVVYGSLSEGSSVGEVCIDKRSYVHIVDLLMETLKSDNEDTLSIHSKVLVWWRMIKDGIVTPLLVNLCYKAGLELPPCFMRLPQELKHKILESLPGVDIATLACVSSELRDLAENDLWKQKCMAECKHLVTEGNDVVNWKERFATYWSQQRNFSSVRLRALQVLYQGAWVRGNVNRGGRNY